MTHMFKKRILGSNQYKETFKRIRPAGKKHIKFMQFHWLVKLIFIFALAMSILALISYWYVNSPVEPIVSPVAAKEVSNSKITMGHVVTSKMDVIKMIVAEFEDQGSSVVARAIKIANCESKFNEDAEHWNTNGSVDRGIFQINSIHGYSSYKLFAAYENIKIAKAMFIRNGHSWNAWVCK